jgi:hypothetical protein
MLKLSDLPEHIQKQVQAKMAEEDNAPKSIDSLKDKLDPLGEKLRKAGKSLAYYTPPREINFRKEEREKFIAIRKQITNDLMRKMEESK